MDIRTCMIMNVGCRNYHLVKKDDEPCVGCPEMEDEYQEDWE